MTMRRSQPEAAEVSVVNVMEMATNLKRRMRGSCAVNMLSMRAHGHSRLSGIAGMFIMTRSCCFCTSPKGVFS